jgi:peptidyl-prolyl cis-trans isomerase C
VICAGRRPVVVVLVLSAATGAGGCGTRSGPQPTYSAPSGEVARVGDDRVGAALIAEVARARGVTPSVAMAALVEDALAAQGARAQGLDRSPEVQWESTAALGRQTPQLLLAQARAKGSPTDDELARLEVVHAVVLRSPSLSEGSALFTVHAIADAVAKARSTEDFMARAKTASGEARTSIEALRAFDASGRMEDGQVLDPDFVAAAFALHRPGETSPIVETSFGWHVLRLVSRRVPAGAALEASRSELAESVVALRARGALAEVLRARRQRTRIDVSAGAGELMAQVPPMP